MADWYCLNCSSITDLDQHGRCPVCGSDSVDIAIRPPKIEKRTWVYVRRPKEFEIGFHACGHTDPDWSEYAKHLWCPSCSVDFIPDHWGILDGPVLVNICRLLGISFDRFNLETQQIEQMK